MTIQEFQPVDEVKTDDRRRVPLTKAGVQPDTHYGVSAHPDGRIMLTPMRLIPEREMIVWENEQLRASLARGIADVRAGNIADLDLDALDVPDDAE